MQAGFKNLALQSISMSLVALTGLQQQQKMPSTSFLWLLYCHFKGVWRILINNFIPKFVGLLPARVCLQIVNGYANEEVSCVIYWSVYHLSWFYLSIDEFVRFTCRLERSLERPCIFFKMHRQAFVWNSKFNSESSFLICVQSSQKTRAVTDLAAVTHLTAL